MLHKTLLLTALFEKCVFSAPTLEKSPDLDKRVSNSAQVDHIICSDGSTPKPTEISGWFSCQPDYFQETASKRTVRTARAARDIQKQEKTEPGPDGQNYLSMPWAIFKRSQEQTFQPSVMKSQHTVPRVVSYSNTKSLQHRQPFWRKRADEYMVVFLKYKISYLKR